MVNNHYSPLLTIIFHDHPLNILTIITPLLNHIMVNNHYSPLLTIIFHDHPLNIWTIIKPWLNHIKPLFTIINHYFPWSSIKYKNWFTKNQVRRPSWSPWRATFCWRPAAAWPPGSAKRWGRWVPSAGGCCWRWAPLGTVGSQGTWDFCWNWICKTHFYHWECLAPIKMVNWEMVYEFVLTTLGSFGCFLDYQWSLIIGIGKRDFRWDFIGFFWGGFRTILFFP